MASSLSSLEHLATSFPFWSYLVHFAVAGVLVLVQNLLSLSKALNIHFTFLNEFFASVAWNVWSLENLLICCMWSQRSCLLSLWFRLLLGPLVLQRGYANPCSLLFRYLSNTHPRSNDGRECLLLFLAQLLAIPAGLALSMTIWNFLAESGLSDDHTTFLHEKMEFFLSVPPFTGFLIEIFVTLLTFIPGISFPESIPMTIVNVFLIVFLVFWFGAHTGAFMNPMVALTYLLMWHYGNANSSTMLIHLFVFWVGPLVATVMAVFVARFLPGKRHVD